MMYSYIGIIILCVCIIVTSASLFLLVKAIYEILKKKRLFKINIIQILKLFCFGAMYSGLFIITILKLKNNNFFSEKQTNLYVWIILISYITFIVYYFVTSIFTKHELRLFAVTLVGISGSIGYAFIMFIIDLAIKGQSGFKYFYYFIFAMITYVFTQKLTRSNIISFANQQVYKFRKHVFNIVLNTSHEKLENTDSGRIYTCINNDMEILGNSMRDVVTVITNIITIIICFIYLTILNFKCFIFAILVFAIAVAFEMIYVKNQEKVFEKLMLMQHKLYNFLDSLIRGHKELAINQRKQIEYEKDINVVNEKYMETRVDAENRMTNTFVIGQTLVYIVIGIVVFVFPILFHEVNYQVLQSYTMVFLFIINPISYLVDLAPKAFQAKVSYSRIIKLIGELEVIVDHEQNRISLTEKNIESIQLRDVTYSYNKDKEGSSFMVGPINCTFAGSQINFIIGGNGSGKSTLAKIITGLYHEQNGEVLINGKPNLPESRGELFSTVFSDYYLFKKIYGIDTNGKEEFIKKYLDKLNMSDKVTIENNELNTIDLSSGQKRIALLLCYLEDKDIYLFDEWAADQDVEFRKFFYMELLPEMKKQGKTIIAITHDDRYFDIADNIFYMEMGKITQRGKFNEQN